MTRYNIIDCIGSGGCGKVFRVWDSHLGRIVVLKFSSPVKNAELDAHFEEQLEREARVTAGLNHPNIVTVYDTGELNGRKFISMEHVDGPNVSKLEHLDGKRLAEIMLDVVGALKFAHDNEIIHRDIKPENILVASDGRVLVADFGLANVMSAGTPGFISGPQMMGLAPTPFDDIYSTGATIKYLMKQFRITHPSLEAIAVKCMNGTYRSAGEVENELGKIGRKSLLPVAVAILLALFAGTSVATMASETHTEAVEASNYWCRVGESKVAKNDDLGAIMAFGKALAVKPSARTYLYRSFAYWRMLRCEESLLDVRKALKLEPANKEALRCQSKLMDALSNPVYESIRR